MQTRRHDPRVLDPDENGERKPDPEETGQRQPSGKLESDPIVNELRKFYDEIVDEPVPDELLELLRRLDEAERNR